MVQRKWCGWHGGCRGGGCLLRSLSWLECHWMIVSGDTENRKSYTSFSNAVWVYFV